MKSLVILATAAVLTSSCSSNRPQKERDHREKEKTCMRLSYLDYIMAIPDSRESCLDEEESFRRKLRLAKLSYDSCMESPPSLSKKHLEDFNAEAKAIYRDKVSREQVKDQCPNGVWEFFHKLSIEFFDAEQPKLCDRHVKVKNHIIKECRNSL